MAIAHDTDDEQRRHWNGPGGRAWVEDRQGGGASFRVFFPTTAPEPEAAAS